MSKKVLSNLLWELHLRFGGTALRPDTLEVVSPQDTDAVVRMVEVQGPLLRSRKDIREFLNRGWGPDDYVFTAYDEQEDKSVIGIAHGTNSR